MSSSVSGSSGIANILSRFLFASGVESRESISIYFPNFSTTENDFGIIFPFCLLRCLNRVLEDKEILCVFEIGGN